LYRLEEIDAGQNIRILSIGLAVKYNSIFDIHDQHPIKVASSSECVENT